MTKAIFFDIDGTLVSFRTHCIPQSALDAIKAAREMGVKVFIATGRPIPFIDNLGTMEYDGIIACNGAFCCLADGTVIVNNRVPEEDVRTTIEYIKEHDIPTSFVSTEKAFMTKSMPEADEVYELLGLNVPPIKPADYALTMNVLQIISFFTKEQESDIMEHALPHCVAERWHPAFADCIARGNNKATGIDAVIKHLGIDLSETMAFGDGGNDIAMLRHVALGVAMGNASDEVKAVANYVTDSVDNDGVAKAIYKFFASLRRASSEHSS